MNELPEKIEMSVSDLILFNGVFAVGLGRALDKAGVMDSSYLADQLSHWSESGENHPAKDLMRAIVQALRNPDDPHHPEFRVIDGGKQ